MAQTTTAQATDMLRLDACTSMILDVRTQPEYAAKRLSSKHIFVPLDALDGENFLLRHGLDADVKIFTLCQSGSRARKAAEKLTASGLRHVQAIEGGIISLESAGFATEGNAPASDGGNLSIERQVRIGAGSLVLLSFILAFLIHPYFLALAVFVAAGLVFAGITNFCGMAMLLMKAPWNAKCSGSSCAIGAGADKGHGCQ